MTMAIHFFEELIRRWRIESPRCTDDASLFAGNNTGCNVSAVRWDANEMPF
jgi:hypothetical protein